MNKLTSALLLLSAAALVIALPSTAQARPDGRYGTDCAGCHGSVPGQPPVDPTPPADPPVTPPADPPTDPVTPPADPPTDPVTPPADPPTDPVTPPADPPTDPVTPPVDPPTDPTDPPVDVPDEIIEHILGVELSTICDYGDLNDPNDRAYVFVALVETCLEVNRIEIVTPSGKLIQINPDELFVNEEENYRTEFFQDGDVLVWRYETAVAEKGQLKEYGTGKYKISVFLSDEQVESANVRFETVKGKKPKKVNPPKEKNGDHENDDHSDHDDD